MHTRVQWLSPSPLWDDFYTAADKTPFRRPALLRFAADTFMEDLQKVLAAAPAQLRNYIARYETWREPSVGLDAPAPQPVRVYQPVHQRYYLVTASLACQLPGLPDHTVQLPQKETVTFVLRRVTEDGEYAWIAGDPVKGWSEASPDRLALGEEQLPMFPFQFDSHGRKRRLWAGLIPATRKQSYVNAQIVAPVDPTGVPAEDIRLTEFQRDVLGPWRLLATNANPRTDAFSSAYILIDLATFLRNRLGDVLAGTPKNQPQTDLYNLLHNTKNPAGRSVWDAMVDADKMRRELEANPSLSSLPAGYQSYSLADPGPSQLGKFANPADPTVPNEFEKKMKAALEATAPAPASTVRVPSKEPEDPANDDTYVIRCVYTRPQCGPGALPDISPETEPFELVGFFDPDAPARPLHVELPLDVSPAALRKSDKNVAFTISGQLQKQLDRVKSLKDLSDGTISPEGGLTFGWICSLSIPIITICAFILLLVLVIALNLVFFWIPFFKICFPVPKLKK